MSTKDLINAIAAGSAVEIENAFNSTMAEKISSRLDDMRVQVAQSMFSSESTESVAESVMKKKVVQGEVTFQAQQQGPSEEVELTNEELDAQLQEVLSKDAAAGEWIDDFVKSDNPKFEGKSKEKRKQMALAAYYAKQRGE